VKVLIVDDEEKILASLKKGLEEHGYIVDVARNGIEGKSMALAKDYKIIISDIIMPGKSGVQMLKEIRENGLNALVLILTALNNVEDKLMVYEVGADDYLVKPFDFRELLARLKALSKRSQINGNLGEENELVYGSLTLNILTKDVYMNGEPLFLTPKEFELLKYFMSNPERTITKNELLQKIWEIDFETSTNVLEVFINFLRKKLEKNSDTKYIQTLPRVGYIFKTNK